MDKLKNWISKNDQEFLTFSYVVIGFLSGVFIFVNIYKIIKALSGGNLGDAAKNFAYALLIGVVALIGIAGVRAFVNANKPTDLIDYQ